MLSLGSLAATSLIVICVQIVFIRGFHAHICLSTLLSLFLHFSILSDEIPEALPSKKQTHRSWKPAEVHAVLSSFEALLKAHKLPGKRLIEDCKSQNKEALKDRSWLNVKYYCKQYVEKLKKSS